MTLGLFDPAFLGGLAAPSPGGFLFDDYPNAAAAYSLRQLRTGVTSVVRVRRSSDNTESDFTAAEVSDGTLAAWVGAGNNGFVRTWYDQSGNGQDAIQTTAASQPKIVDSSAGLVLENGKPGVAFDGSDDYLQAAGVSVAQPTSIVTVVKKTNTSHYFDGATSRITLYGLTNSLSLFSGVQLGPVSYISNTQQLFFVIADSTDVVYANSTQRLSGNAGSSALTSLLLGRQSAGLNYANQIMQDFIIYPSNQSANRAAIEANINAHYSIF